MTRPTVHADRALAKVRVPVPADAFTDLLAHIAAEYQNGLGVLLEDISTWTRLVNNEDARDEAGVSYDEACRRREEALDALTAKLPGVVWEMDAVQAGRHARQVDGAATTLGLPAWARQDAARDVRALRLADKSEQALDGLADVVALDAYGVRTGAES